MGDRYQVRHQAIYAAKKRLQLYEPKLTSLCLWCANVRVHACVRVCVCVQSIMCVSLNRPLSQDQSTGGEKYTLINIYWGDMQFSYLHPVWQVQPRQRTVRQHRPRSTACPSPPFHRFAAQPPRPHYRRDQAGLVSRNLWRRHCQLC